MQPQPDEIDHAKLARLLASTDRLVKPFPPLPFSLQEAKADPVRCRELVGIRTWEERVELPRLESDPRKPYDISNEKHFTHYLDENTLRATYQQGLEVSYHHWDIANNVFALNETRQGIENYWMNVLEELDRERYILFALDEAMKGTSVESQTRALCPDVGLQFAKDPRGYVDLLRFIIRSGSSFSKRDDYHPVVSEHFDKIFGIPRNAGETSQLPVPRAIRAFQTQAQHSRNQFIAMFVWHILVLIGCTKRMYYPGILRSETPRLKLPEAQYQVARSSHQTQASDRNRMQSLRSELGYERFQCEFRPITTPEVCRSCARFVEEVEELVKDGKKLMYCPKCLKIGRKVPYCGQECFAIDMKQGDHRVWCGRQFSDLGLPFAGYSARPTHPPLSTMLYIVLDNLKKEPPYSRTIYEFRVNSSTSFDLPTSPAPSPARLDNLLSWRLKAQYSSSPLEALLHQAVKTRNDNDIRSFIRQVFALLPPGTLTLQMAIRQVADDWSSPVRTVRGWFA